MCKSVNKKVVAKQSTAKKPVKKSNNSKRLLNLIRHHKLLTFLLILLMLFPLGFGYEKYKDWDNAQMIKGLARDFPKLVEEIEAATGLDLEIKKSCMTTTEKFSSGVRTCEVIAYASTETSKHSEVEEILGKSIFRKHRKYDNGLGYKYSYRKKDSCGLGLGARGEGVVSFSCLTAVRDANVELAKEVFRSIPE